MDKGFKVIKSNGLSLIQDTGRIGYAHYGVSQSGSVDNLAHFWCNQLLENDNNATVIEITLGGFAIESQIDTYISVCGADLDITLNGNQLALWQTHLITEGDQLVWKKRISGLRSYLGVKNGFLVNKTLQSSATNTREKLGGLNGQGDPLQTHDIIPCEPYINYPKKYLNNEHIPTYLNKITLNLLPSYQYHQFNDSYHNAFFSCDFTVSKNINRVGYRLQGDIPRHSITLPYSEAMTIGAVQIPPNGQPIIMLNDAPTIGGYPKIGNILKKDLYKVAQAYTGNKITFNYSQ